MLKRCQNRKLKFIFLAILGFSIFGWAEKSWAETIWCNPANSGAEDGITKATGYNTLHEALSAMISGDTITIANGDWRNTAGMYIDSNHKPPDGAVNAYSKVYAETDWEVKLPYIKIETASDQTQGYLEFRGLVFDNQYIGSGSGHINYHMHHTKFIRCAFLAHGLSGNNHAVGWGNSDGNDFSKNQYNLMEDCAVWGSGRYMVYNKYGQYNVFRRVVVRHDLHTGNGGQDDGQISNFRSYSSINSHYQNCLSIDSDRMENYAVGPYDGEASGFWLGDQGGGAGNTCSGCMSIKDMNRVYYMAGADDGIQTITNSFAIDPISFGDETVILISKNNIGLDVSNFLGKGRNVSGQTGFQSANAGIFTIINSIIEGISSTAENGTSNTYIDHWNAIGGVWGSGAKSYDPEVSGLLYPLRIETSANLATDGSSGGQIGPTILKKIGISGTLYGETGWSTVTDEDLWPFPNEDKIKELMSATVAGVSGSYGFTAYDSPFGSPNTLTSYIWEYLGNQIPCEIYNTCGADTTPPAAPSGLSVL